MMLRKRRPRKAKGKAMHNHSRYPLAGGLHYAKLMYHAHTGGDKPHSHSPGYGGDTPGETVIREVPGDYNA